MAIVARAPGKLFIAGEYAVTTTGAPAIITSVPRYLTVTLTPSQQGLITSEKYDNTLAWTRSQQHIQFEEHFGYRLITQTLLTVETYIRNLGIDTTQCYTIHIQSDLDDSTTGQKYGLGSSGAVTVALVKALLAFYDQSLEPLLVYKLACLIHLSLNSNGSFADLATCAFDTCIYYQLFDKKWVVKQQKKLSIAKVIALDWPQLTIKPLPFPQGVTFLIGWTKTPASTEQLVADIKNIKKTVQYKRFLQTSQRYVVTLMTAFEQNDLPTITNTIRRCRQLLKQLSANIETEALKNLCQGAEQFNCAAKVSGAGGGDCGFCCLTDTIHQSDIISFWQQHDIIPLFTLGEQSHDHFTV